MVMHELSASVPAGCRRRAAAVPTETGHCLASVSRSHVSQVQPTYAVQRRESIKPSKSQSAHRMFWRHHARGSAQSDALPSAEPAGSSKPSACSGGTMLAFSQMSSWICFTNSIASCICNKQRTHAAVWSCCDNGRPFWLDSEHTAYPAQPASQAPPATAARPYTPLAWRCPHTPPHARTCTVGRRTITSAIQVGKPSCGQRTRAPTSASGRQ